MGRHSNLLLLDEKRSVIAIGRQVRDHQSRVRPIGTGDLYAPPPALRSCPPRRDESFERWQERLQVLPVSLKRALQETYQGISPALAAQLSGSHFEVTDDLLCKPVQQLSEQQWLLLHERWHVWLNSVLDEHFVLESRSDGSYQTWGETSKPASKGLALKLGNYYRERLDQRSLHEQNRELQQLLHQLRQRNTNTHGDTSTRTPVTCHAPWVHMVYPGHPGRF